jgi:uncharacterized membrane protein
VTTTEHGEQDGEDGRGGAGVRSRREALAGRRAVVAVGVGVAAGAVAGVLLPWQAAVLCGWDAAAVVFLVWVGATVVRAGTAATAAHARREDSSRTAADLMLLGASAASLGAVLLTLLKASGDHGGAKAALAGLALFSIVASWAVVHLVFTLKYARLYFTEAPGGIDFHDGSTEHPYLDFAYVAFTIGMTYQVSDSDLTARSVRSTALRQALLSFLFGTAIIATTINLIAGLAH